MAIRKLILLFLTGILLTGNSSFRAFDSSDADEYTVKAAFIYLFTGYVDWNSYDEAQGVFNIAILGDSGIIPPMYVIANNKKAKNNRIVVKQYLDLEEIGACQVLFISKNNTIPIETIISRFRDRPVLLITEEKGGCEKGAHINFLASGDKLRFEVNLRAASRSGLKISSQLLQHAFLIVR